MDMIAFKIKLSTKEIRNLTMLLEAARKKGDLEEVNRITSLISLGSGYDVETVSEILMVGMSTIYQTVKKYLTRGLQALVSKKRPGRPPKLTKNQRKKLAAMIDDGPEKHGFSGGCWRTPMVQELILQKFGVFHSVKYLSELLNVLGFSYQKAKFVAANRNEEARQEWLNKTWPKIKKAAKKSNGYILFGDEASFPQWGTLSYTWSRKGHQPVVKTSGNRKGYKVFGLIDYFTGRFFSKGHVGKLNALSYIEFLSEVLSKTRKHIYLIQDGAPYHKGALMRAFFEKNSYRLTVHTLPSYSPDFNPIEKLWKKIKEHGTHLKYFPTFESLIDKVNETLIDFSNSATEVLALFGFYENLSCRKT